MEETLKQILIEMQDMKKEMNQRFDSVDERFNGLNHKLDVIREQTAANSSKQRDTLSSYRCTKASRRFSDGCKIN